MPSFDIVSEIDSQNVRNAVENSSRELESRFDFRGVEASFEWKADETTVSAESDFQLDQLLDILRAKLIKHKIEANVMEVSDAIHSGKLFFQKISFKEGIEVLVAKKIVKLVKDKKLKVQTTIQGEQLRVTGKKRDDLQAVMSLVKEANLGQPFQFKNFRD